MEKLDNVYIKNIQKESLSESVIKEKIYIDKGRHELIYKKIQKYDDSSLIKDEFKLPNNLGTLYVYLHKNEKGDSIYTVELHSGYTLNYLDSNSFYPPMKKEFDKYIKDVKKESLSSESVLKEDLNYKQKQAINDLIKGVNMNNVSVDTLNSLDSPELDEILNLQKKQILLVQKLSKRLDNNKESISSESINESINQDLYNKFKKIDSNIIQSLRELREFVAKYYPRLVGNVRNVVDEYSDAVYDIEYNLSHSKESLSKLDNVYESVYREDYDTRRLYGDLYRSEQDDFLWNLTTLFKWKSVSYGRDFDHYHYDGRAKIFIYSDSIELIGTNWLTDRSNNFLINYEKKFNRSAIKDIERNKKIQKLAKEMETTINFPSISKLTLGELQQKIYTLMKKGHKYITEIDVELDKMMNKPVKESVSERLNSLVEADEKYDNLTDKEYNKLAKDPNFAMSSKAQDFELLSKDNGKLACNLAWHSLKSKNGWDKTKAAQDPKVLLLNNGAPIGNLQYSDYWMNSPAAGNEILYKRQTILNRLWPLNDIGDRAERWLRKYYAKFSPDLQKRIRYAMSGISSDRFPDDLAKLLGRDNKKKD